MIYVHITAFTIWVARIYKWSWDTILIIYYLLICLFAYLFIYFSFAQWLQHGEIGLSNKTLILESKLPHDLESKSQQKKKFFIEGKTYFSFDIFIIAHWRLRPCALAIKHSGGYSEDEKEGISN